MDAQPGVKMMMLYMLICIFDLSIVPVLWFGGKRLES